jgi:hypothetical protein
MSGNKKRKKPNQEVKNQDDEKSPKVKLIPLIGNGQPSVLSNGKLFSRNLK